MINAKKEYTGQKYGARAINAKTKLKMMDIVEFTTQTLKPKGRLKAIRHGMIKWRVFVVAIVTF